VSNLQTIRLIYTKRQWNPVSWLIRWVLPISLFRPAKSSHVIIVDGNGCLEAHMRYGVRSVGLEDALKGLTVVDDVSYLVRDSKAGLSWGRTQIGTPYDWPGAFGLALEPDRNWQEDNAWFCFELAAAILARAGRDVFADTGHITGTMLLSLKP
jgi:uncharacterized protein YycO